jgi:RNA polymerase sigma factor (sigma-70 family)
MTLNQQTQRPDPRALLEAFLTSSRSEEAFAALVMCLSGLVYSSALRRTGNAQLAEEVTQNVFAIMARKASSLVSHPSLEAWTLETTRLEAAAVMRSEKRQQRKLAALAIETDIISSTSNETMNPSATWEDALPALDEALDSLSTRERDVILQRFYVGKKFQEIAEATGHTEASCKMRLKRALEKLCLRMSTRGVTLTATAVASLLTTDYARSAPVQSAASLASNALAASNELSTASLLLNAFQTMSTIKSSAMTAAAVLALAAIPLSSQYAEGSRLQSQLANREAEAAASQQLATVKVTNPSSAGNAAGMLALRDQKSDNVSIIRSLLTSGYTDTLKEQVILAKISQMPSAERTQFLAELEKFPCNEFRKRGIVSSIAKLSPEFSPRENLERMIQLGQTSADFDYQMRDWAKADPEAALQWYQETKAAGKFYPGLDNDFQKETSSQFIDGAVKTNPQLAMDFYQANPRDEMGAEALRLLARGVSDAVVKSGDPAMVLTLLDLNTQPEDRKDILEGMLYSHVNVQKYDEGAAFVEAYEPDEERRYSIMRQVLQTVEPDKIEGALTWMLVKTYEKEGVKTVRRLVEDSKNRAYDYPGWYRRQAPEVQQQLPKLEGFTWDEK